MEAFLALLMLVGGGVLWRRLTLLQEEVESVRERLRDLQLWGRAPGAHPSREAAPTPEVESRRGREATYSEPEPAPQPPPATDAPTIEAEPRESPPTHTEAPPSGVDTADTIRSPSIPPGPSRELQTGLDSIPAAARVSPADPVQTVRQRVRNLGPKDPDLSWEMALGTFWLPRLGVAALTVAVAFLLTMALGKGGPITRVGLGYLACVTLLVLAWRLEAKYRGYARVLLSGGLALSYFVTYATYYLPFARLPGLDSPAPTLTALVLVVAAWAVLAQRRSSPTMAVLVTVFGHVTIALSSFATETPAAYSVLGIVALSAGSAFFLLANRWYYVAALGVVGTYLNHFVVLQRAERVETPGQLALALGVLGVYLAIFALAELLSPEELRRRTVPVWFRTSLVTLNTGCFFVLATLVVDDYPGGDARQHLLRYSLAAFLLAMAWAYRRRRGDDPLHNAYWTKSMVFVTLGLAAQFAGATLTAALAVQMVALLVTARRTGLLVTRLLAFAAALAAFIHGVSNSLGMELLAYSAEGYAVELVRSLVPITAFFVAASIYGRTDWSSRSPRTAPFGDETSLWLWQLDLLSDPPGGHEFPKPLDGLLIPHAFATAGTLLLVGSLDRFAVPDAGHRLLVASVATLVLAALAWRLEDRSFGLASMLMVLVAVTIGTDELRTRIHRGLAVASLLALASTALGSEVRLLGRRRGLALHQSPNAPYLLYGGVTVLLGLFFSQQFEPTVGVFGLAGSAFLLALAGRWLHTRSMTWASVALLIWGVLVWQLEAAGQTPAWRHAVAWLLVGLALVGERYYASAFFESRQVGPAGAVLLVSIWPLLLQYVAIESETGWAAFGWSLCAVGFLTHGLVLHRPVALVLSLLTTVGASAVHTVASVATSVETAPLVIGFLALVSLWILYERLLSKGRGRLGLDLPDVLGAAFVASAAVLLLVFFERLPQTREHYLTISWSATGFGLFLLAWLWRKKWYRYASLAVLGLSSLRVAFIDTRELTAYPRIAAWAVLGIVLIALGYGYVRAFSGSTESDRSKTG